MTHNNVANERVRVQIVFLYVEPQNLKTLSLCLPCFCVLACCFPLCVCIVVDYVTAYLALILHEHTDFQPFAT